MDPRARLHSGLQAANEGRFEDALREYVWFHEHALEHDRAFYGVRLSFALSYWLDLAKAYPAARRKLEKIRDRKTALLACGGGNRALFHDVESINDYLGAERATYELFLTMLQISPMLATSCADLAIESIVKARDFPLAEKHSPSPEDALLRFSNDLNADVADLGGNGEDNARRLEAYTHIYCDRVATVIAILMGLGKSEEAKQCREWAVALVESKPLRARIQKVLLSASR
jgi:hypothetical protein